MNNLKRNPRYALRKLTIGLASVMFGSVIFAVSAIGAKADTIETSTQTDQDVAVVPDGANEANASTTVADHREEILSNNSADQNQVKVNQENPAANTVETTTDAKAVHLIRKQQSQPLKLLNFQRQTTNVQDKAEDKINWNAVKYERDENGVKITGWDPAVGGYEVLLPNTSDFVMHGDIKKTQIAEITDEDMQKIMFTLANNDTSKGQNFSITISHNNDAQLANNKLHATSNFAYEDGSGYFTYAFSTNEYSKPKDGYTNNLVRADLENLDMSKIRDISGIFRGASKLQELKISSWDVSNVRYFDDAFGDTKNLKNLNIEDWKFYQGSDQTISIQSLFKNSGIESLDLSKWNTSNFYHTGEMFLNTPDLRFLNISNWDMSNSGLMLFGSNPDQNASGVRVIIANNIKTTKLGLDPFKLDHPFVIFQDNMDQSPIINVKYWNDVNKFKIDIKDKDTNSVKKLLKATDDSQEKSQLTMHLGRILFKDLADFNNSVNASVESAKKYEKGKGYKVDDNVRVIGALPTDLTQVATFLENDGAAFELTRSHNITEVTTPVKKGDLIPGTTDSHYDKDVTEADLSRTVTRTIKIIAPDGKVSTITQTVTFNKPARVDNVTGKVILGDWSEVGQRTFDEFKVPKISGYVPSQKIVSAKTVTPEAKDSLVTIVYTKDNTIDNDDNIATTEDNGPTNNNGSTQGPDQEQGIDGIIMHLSIAYDKAGNKTPVRYKLYTPIKYLPNAIVIKGRAYYKLANKDEYVLTTNVTGVKRTLKHSAYVYNGKGKRIGLKKFTKGKKLTTYGRHVILKNGKAYYCVGKGQYVRMRNFR